MSKGLFNKINIATGVKKKAGEKNVVVELTKSPMKEFMAPKIENDNPILFYTINIITIRNGMRTSVIPVV